MFFANAKKKNVRNKVGIRLVGGSKQKQQTNSIQIWVKSLK